jgi:hypothetical protein
MDVHVRLTASPVWATLSNMRCNPARQEYADQLCRQRISLREQYADAADQPALTADVRIADLRQQIAAITGELEKLEAEGIRPRMSVA